MTPDAVAETLDRVPVPFLPLKLAIIGVDIPGFPCFEPSVFGWREAMYGPLRSRNLWVPEGFGMTDGLLLEGNGFLNIWGGGGPNLGNCERGFNGGPMFYGPKGSRWGLTVSGFSVDGRGDAYKDSRNHSWDIGEAFFAKWLNCMAWRGGGDGYYLHDEIQCVDFENTIESDNGGFGCRVQNGTNIHWTGGAGAAERNALGAILWEAGLVQAYAGIGTIRKHFELNGGPAIDLRGVHSVSVKNSYTYASDFVHDEHCRNLEITHNEIVSWGTDPDGFPNSRIIGPRAGHTIGRNTYARLNADGVTGELYPDPDDAAREMEKQFQRSFSIAGWTLGRFR